MVAEAETTKLRGNLVRRKTSKWWYARYKVDGKELLFDNEADPYQLVNLAETGSEEAGRICNELRAMMEARMAELNDNFEVSSFYRENWISPDREILKTAKTL